jgi:transposase-like protein
MIDDKKEFKRREYTEDEKERLFSAVCETMMTEFIPVGRACKVHKVPKTTILQWRDKTPEHQELYARARSTVVDHWAEEVLTVSDETPSTFTDANGSVRIDGAAVQHARLRVDSRKWLLSKLRPKVYGDKVTTEVTGADGGPITSVTLGVEQLKGLTDEELATMTALLEKAVGGKK